MNTYVYSVEQVIEIRANSEEEAKGLLPIYPTGFEGQAYYVQEETVELLRDEGGRKTTYDTNNNCVYCDQYRYDQHKKSCEDYVKETYLQFIQRIQKEAV